LIIRDGFLLVSINEAVTSPASVLPVVSDGAAVKLAFSRPNPPKPKLPQQGWAIQQPDLQRPPMSSEHALWLNRMIKLPGNWQEMPFLSVWPMFWQFRGISNF
jgi:hypothetical protein